MSKQNKSSNSNSNSKTIDLGSEFWIEDSVAKGQAVMVDYHNILVGVSGGSDSDVVMDYMERNFKEYNKTYVFYFTGLEYQATKDHLKYLEDKYNVSIVRVNPEKPIPLAIHQTGVPFMSKYVSEMIKRLQEHNFKWEDKPFIELLDEYCDKQTYQKSPKYKLINGYWYKGCVGALQWWCNENGENSSFNIDRNKYLKEFMIANPPTFKINNKCCYYAKKLPAQLYQKEHKIDLNILGLRRSEGGIRSTSFKTCFDKKEDEMSKFRPIFWYNDKTKEDYCNKYNVVHSKCYTEYGLKRTGCCGCPYSQDLWQELEICKQYEPKLYKALYNIFGKSYDYTKQYEEFRKDMELDKII